MAMISERDAEELRKEFSARLVGPVKLRMFSQANECQYCAETRQIVEEVATLSDKITTEVYDFVADKAAADEAGIDKIPAIAVVGTEDGADKDYGIRFYGIPSGYEFTSLIEDILVVSRRETGLKPATKESLRAITTPVHIQVFVTPTCPYCPHAVHLAHAFAVENDKIRADMVEAIEFPHLTAKYKVHGVPRIVINDTVYQEGSPPEALMLAKVLEAVHPKKEEKRPRRKRASRAPKK